MPDILAPQLPKRRNKRKTTAELCELFIAQVSPTLASNSIVVVARALFSMRKSLAGRPPTREQMHHWLRRRLSVDKVSPATLSVERTYANRFFEWCINEGYMVANPLRGIPKVPIRLVNKPEITESDYRKLLSAAEGSQWFPFFTLAWHTGGRAVDLANLQWHQVFFSENIATLQFVPIKTQKSGREVRVCLPIDPSLNLAVYGSFRQGDLLFPEIQQLHSRGDGSFQRAFNGVCKKAGLESHITFHCFRHTRARRMLTGPNKVTPLVAADVLGISNMATLRRYSPASMEEKARATQL